MLDLKCPDHKEREAGTRELGNISMVIFRTFVHSKLSFYVLQCLNYSYSSGPDTPGPGLTWFLDDSVAGVGDLLPFGLVWVLVVVEVAINNSRVTLITF